MLRRTFVQTLASATAFLVAGFGRRVASEESELSKDIFACGVASGDPTADAVVIWTRVSAAGDSTEQKSVRWQVANDAWRDGAQNHQPDEGEWTTRRDAALQAWFEWMPVRSNRRNERRRKGVTPIFRDFRYGNLASVVMLDARLYGRDAQPHVGETATETVTEQAVTDAMRDPARRMLGCRQERWLRKRLQTSADTVWQIIGQQVMVANMRSADLEPVVNLDGPSYFSREALENAAAMYRRVAFSQYCAQS